MAVVQTFNVKGTDYNVHDTKAVYFTNDQSLTEAQKTQAATNIGVRNFSFTISSDPTQWITTVIPNQGSYKTQDINVPGVKATYACTPWICPEYSSPSNPDPDGDTAKLEAFTSMEACYVSTSSNTVTVRITGQIPNINIPCNLTVWG